MGLVYQARLGHLHWEKQKQGATFSCEVVLDMKGQQH